MSASDPPLSRAQELWAAKLMARQEWTLPETLYWIIYRDPEQVGRGLDFGSSPVVGSPPEVLINTCKLVGAEVGIEAEPFDALELEILRGNVIAIGDVVMSSAGRSRHVIKPREWEDLGFYRDRYGVSPSTLSYRDNPDSRYLTDLRFERAGVVATFKPPEIPHQADIVRLEAPNLSVPSASDGPTKPNVPMGQLSLNKWLVDPTVGRCAAARLEARGGAPEDEAELRKELLQMLAELGPLRKPLADRDGFSVRRLFGFSRS